jgi:predicted SprT family Zn-dependent metalloprotease
VSAALLREVRAEAEALMAAYAPPGWTFEFDRAVRRLGACHPGSQKITLSRPFVLSGTSRGVIRNTVLHEIAHALAGPGNGHNATWRAIAIRIGCDGKRCHSEPAPVAHKWRAVCDTCGSSVLRHRRPSRTSACSRCCGGKFNARFVLSWERVA